MHTETIHESVLIKTISLFQPPITLPDVREQIIFSLCIHMLHRIPLQALREGWCTEAPFIRHCRAVTSPLNSIQVFSIRLFLMAPGGMLRRKRLLRQAL